MRGSSFAAACALLVLILLGADGAKPKNLKDFVTAGYIPDYRFSGIDWQGLGEYVSDFILFSLEPTPEGGLTGHDRIPKALLDKAREVRKFVGFKMHISVGGGGRSDAFYTIVQSAALRTKFAATIVRYCAEEKLDGIDIDWELPFENYPTVGPGFRQLLKQIKDKNKDLFVTVAVHADAHKNLPANLFKTVDRVHLMLYDMCKGPPCRHSTLESVNASMISALEVVPAHKLMLGIPSYARVVDEPDMVATYADIVRKHGVQPKNVDEVEGYYYNGPHTVEKKIRLANESHLLGIFFWELGQDLPIAHPDSIILAGGREADIIRKERKSGKKTQSFAQRHDHEDPEKIADAVKKLKNFGIDTDLEDSGIKNVKKTVIDVGAMGGDQRYAGMYDEDDDDNYVAVPIKKDL